MIYLYTENFVWSARIKNWIKLVLKRSSRGPQAVEQSLMRGLKDLGQEFVVNKPPLPEAEVGTACVISGAATLRRVIKQKQQGRFKKIIAGPIISITPLEQGGLITSPEVDAFVVPSLWVKRWWGSLKPSFYDRIKLWPAGVRDPGYQAHTGQEVLVFQKNAPEHLLGTVEQELIKKSLPYKLITYGKFTQTDYFSALEKAKMLIYLSESESQGIALQEAWIRNVPTLVWNRKYMTYKNMRWDDEKISAPLMADACGKFFNGEQDFTINLDNFISQLQNFAPRQYALEHFTDKISAEQYLNIISNL